MAIIDILLIAAATIAVVYAWMKDGGIFEELRDSIEAWGTVTNADLFADGSQTARSWLRNKIATGLLCPQCLSYHVAFWLVMLFYVPSLFMEGLQATIVRMPIYILAIAAIALLAWIGYERPTEELDDDEEGEVQQTTTGAPTGISETDS